MCVYVCACVSVYVCVECVYKQNFNKLTQFVLIIIVI